MIDCNRRRALDQLLASADILVNMARDGQWDQLRRREACYRRDVEAFFARPAAVSETPEIASVLRDLIALQDQIAALAVAERDSAHAGICRLRDGRRAIRAYAAHSAA